MSSTFHFLFMILASLLVFFLIIRILMTGYEYKFEMKRIILLSVIVVVAGMLFGKYGANAGLPWWIYYTVPMLMTIILPPLVLKFNRQKTIFYLVLSFISAPCIHVFFSFFLGWTEYMPFWKIPFIGDIL